MDRYVGIGNNYTPPKREFVSFPMVALPRDERDARFAKSFTLGQPTEYTRFFAEYGFVVIDDVLSQEEVDKTVDQIWADLRAERDTLVREDPRTWLDGWPVMNARSGLLGYSACIDACAFNNRQNPKLYEAFSTILDVQHLWVSIDRYGLMRPTRNIPMKSDSGSGDIEYVDKPEWKTMEKWTHWDMNPWVWVNSEQEYLSGKQRNNDADSYKFDNFISENNSSRFTGTRKVQGLVALSESLESDGGFCCVVGFNNIINDWVFANEEEGKRQRGGSYTTVPFGEPLHEQLQKIPVRAGSLIVWDSTLPHCNYANDSDKFRICQYIKMFPAPKRQTSDTQQRKEELQILFPRKDDKSYAFEMTALGKKLFGLEAWDSGECVLQ